MSKYRIKIEGKVYEMELELAEENAVTAPVEQKKYKKMDSSMKDSTVRVMNPSYEKKTTNNSGVVISPMPGTILSVLKEEGSKVKTGDVVLVLEAMKMENEIVAPKDGTIVKMNCSASNTVSGGDILFEIQ